MTYLYLTNIINHYRILYFTLKNFTDDKNKSYEIFKQEIMRYFTIVQNTIMNEEYIKTGFNNYLDYIKKIDKTNFNFWNELFKLIKSDKSSYFILIIIDQVKYNNDFKNIELLEELLYGQLSTFKLVTLYSINDSNIENFINNL